MGTIRPLSKRGDERTDTAFLAVKDFTERLLSSPAKKDVLKVVVFGSYAKGLAKKGSDVDLLIVSKNGEAIKDIVAELSLEVQMDYNVGLEPIIFPVDDLFPIRSYFLYNILDYGKEVFSVKKEEMKDAERKNLINLAEEYLLSAEDALKGEHFRLAVDAAYNSLELYLKSLILKEEDDLPGSHGGIVGRFGELYVKAGKADKAVGRDINKALELRNNARYKYQATIRKEDAEKIIRLAKKLEELARGTLIVGPASP